MTPPRADVVERLVAAAFQGMFTVSEGTTSDEVISACMSIAHRATIAVENRECLRNNIEQMYALLPPQKVQ